MEVLLNNKSVKKTFQVLPKWLGKPILDTYGNKPVLDRKGKPVFAEIYALEEFKERGYDGVWVDAFRKKFRIDIPETGKMLELPELMKKKLFEINGNGKLKGTWDLFLWKGEEIKFVELKRKWKDEIRVTQIEFFERALRFGLKEDNFEIYEWEEDN